MCGFEHGTFIGCGGMDADTMTRRSAAVAIGCDGCGANAGCHGPQTDKDAEHVCKCSGCKDKRSDGGHQCKCSHQPADDGS